MNIKVIYHCYGSAHTSVVTAAIHAGLLPRDRVPSARQLMAVPHFDRTPSCVIGTPFRMGFDNAGNEVFAIGRGHARAVAERALYSLARLIRYPDDSFLVVNALAVADLWTTIGGTISRGLGLTPWGRPIVIHGVRRSYRRLVALVEQTELTVLRMRKRGDVRQGANMTLVVKLDKGGHV